jgi:hypothetical protein
LGVVRQRGEVANAVVDRDAGGDGNTLLNILAFKFLGDGTAMLTDFGREIRSGKAG